MTRRDPRACYTFSMKRRSLILAGAALAVTGPALAGADPYILEPETSVVGFTYTLNGQRLNGRMPIKSADISVDVDRPSNSRVLAVIDADRADAGPFYATAAMKSDAVLDTAHFPEIRFATRDIENKITNARVLGDLTIRGVTRPAELSATLFRQRGEAAGSREKLSILLTGRVDRRDYGATGYPNLVQPQITLNILTRINRAG